MHYSLFVFQHLGFLGTGPMSGGLRTSVKGYLNAQRLALSGEINTLILKSADDSVDKKKPVKKSIASTSYGLNICDGSMPGLPMLSSDPKVRT